jgi:hypothetical protein
MSRLPNLLVLGAQKAGTSWLNTWLDSHPAVCMAAPKEVGLLLRREAEHDYGPHFRKPDGCRYWGDATPGYLWTPDPAGDDQWFRPGRPDVAEHARALLGPDVRLVVSLRHPVERAVSAYIHHLRRGRFERSQRLRDVAHRFGIVAIGRYRRHVTAWQAQFPQDRFHFIFFDDIVARPARVLRGLFQELGLERMEGLKGARRPINRGLRLRLDEAGAVPDAEHPTVQRTAERMELDGLTVEQADVDALLPLFEDDIRFVMEDLGAARLRWGDRHRLAEFVGAAPD